ncbi:MAG TPA: aminotransferase class V-fold PLP-dependent enzyme [Methanospirillum sp.]|uniref:aminotransferase class V-fold PLP-dependent enzyme n=1 Tax=Methanospirillum sp. TaxID=45200 RepID=UPI002C18DF1A|nr:aminotransferase class V-fold PLP-dependent enzyme [Methanospirillum sp.]HWQ64185.1 aminotransferase class V-fold PLP-dependent enzyme [Methanospirillum sp.]
MQQVDIKDLIYLNNAASTWPKPPCVLDAVAQASSLPYLESGRTTLEGLISYPDEGRGALASFFHTGDPHEWIFTSNATDSLNILIHGFAAGKKSPFHVITTELEHNSVIRPLLALKKAGKISLSIIPADSGGHIQPDLICEAITPETRLAVINHGSNVTGAVQDISEICRILHDEELFSIIDGSQTAGQIPIQLSKIPVDAFVFTGHKYLFGIPGTGGFFIRTPESVLSLHQGGTGFDSASPDHPTEMPARFEAGTPNFPGIAALTAGLGYISDIGFDQICRHLEEMSCYLSERLSDLDAVTLYTPNPETPIFSFNITGVDPDDIGMILGRKYHIVTRTGLHCAPWIHQRLTRGLGCVRMSLSFLNTMEQCRFVADSIEELVV